MRHYICTDDLLYDTGRSDNAIKNRWHLLKRLSRRKAKQQKVSILSSIYTTTTGINNCNYMEQQQQSLSLPAFQSNGPTEDVGPLEDEHSSISESSICLDFMTDDDIITVVSNLYYIALLYFTYLLYCKICLAVSYLNLIIYV